VVIDMPWLEAHLGKRARTHEDVGGNAGLIFAIAKLARAHNNVADDAAVKPGPGKPPAGEQVRAGRPLADHQRVARSIRDRSKIHLPLVGAVTKDQNTAVIGWWRGAAGIARGARVATQTGHAQVLCEANGSGSLAISDEIFIFHGEIAVL